MHAEQIAEAYPVVTLDTSAHQAAELLASGQLPGIIVVDTDRHPHSVLPASQVVRCMVPTYVQDDPSLARVIDESLADRVADKLAKVTVQQMLPAEPVELPVVNHDDTVLEVAAIMARLRCPVVAVVKDNEIIGAITAARLLKAAMPH